MPALKNNIILFLKGIAMGAADAVPGVSGGTIAFISGIYEELINSIRSFDLQALSLLKSLKLKEFWEHINGSFLIVLFAGIASSILLFSRIILYCLVHYPEMLWAFFFGLIIASALIVGKKIPQWNPGIICSAISGIIAGYFITIAVPAQTPETLAFVFFSGMIAICAMILPGISGSFILVLLSKYEYVVTALKDLNLPVILTFVCGCAVGLLSFSHLLNWTLKRFHDLTIAMLTGLMIGSLNKVWPWKEVLETYTNHKGLVKPLVEHNILPTSYFEITGKESYLAYAMCLAVLGFFLVWFLEKMTNKGLSKR